MATRRAAQHLGARRVDRLVGHRVLDVHAQPAQRERRRGVRERQPQPSRQRPPACAPPDPRIAQRLDLLGAGQRDQLDVLPLAELGEIHGDVELPRHRLVERQMALAVDLELVDLGEPPSAARWRTERRWGCRNRSRTHSRALGFDLEQALGALPPRVRRARDGLLDRTRAPRPTRAARAPRTASAPGSWRTIFGTGRAGSPRRAPHRPPPGPTPSPSTSADAADWPGRPPPTDRRPPPDAVMPHPVGDTASRRAHAQPHRARRTTQARGSQMVHIAEAVNQPFGLVGQWIAYDPVGSNRSPRTDMTAPWS